MRSLLIPVSVLVLGACGATNVNQSNYDAVQEAYAAEHGDAHGAGHGDAGKGGDHAAAGAADAGHADAGAADAGHGDGAADAHADGAADAGPDLANGEKVYKQVCISCHGADGKYIGTYECGASGGVAGGHGIHAAEEAVKEQRTKKP